MAQYPSIKEDTVLYDKENVYADQNIKITLLDGSTLEVWGQVFFNGLPVGSVGTIPIASQAEAEAGVNNTNAMTPLRTSQAIDVQVDPVLNGHISAGTGAHAATAVSATPNAAPMTGVNVQAQLGQAATQIATNTAAIGTGSSGLATHISNPTGAHAATAVSAVAGAAPLTGATVQAQLDQARTGINGQSSLITAVDTNLSAHLNDTVDAHDASAVSAVPNVAPMVGTDVQAQLGQAASLLNTVPSQAQNDTRYLALAGGTVTGPVQVPSLTVVNDINNARSFSSQTPPTLDNQLTRKDYVDTKFAGVSGSYTYVESYPPPVANYLTPTVGTVTCADPGVLPAQCTFVFRIRHTGPGTVQAIACQWPTLSWLVERQNINGYGFFFSSPDGSAVMNLQAPLVVPITSRDEILALAVDTTVTTTARLRGWVYNGTTWSPTDYAQAGVATAAVADSASVMRIGQTGFGSDTFDGRIYSVECRTGLDPTAGSVFWKFDANDYPGTGTSYSDPRGRTWNLTSASAITVARPPQTNDTYIDTTSDTLYKYIGGSWQSQGVLGDATAAATVNSLAASRPHLYLSGAASNNVVAPDPPQLAGATQLDIRWIEKAPPNGTAGYTPAGAVFMGQGSNYATASFSILTNAGNSVTFYVNGTAHTSRPLRPATGVAAARFTWRSSDGLTQAFTKATGDVAGMLDNTGWVQNGANMTLPAVPTLNVNDTLAIGAYSNGGAACFVNMLAASFAAAIDGTPFALWRSDTMDETLLDAYGTKWAINGTAWEWRDSSGTKIGSPAQVANEELEEKIRVVTYAAPRTNLYLPGVAGNFISLPDPPQLAGATQLDVRWIEKAPPNGAAGYILPGVLMGQGANYTIMPMGLLNHATSNGLNVHINSATPISFYIRPVTGIAACRVTWRSSDGRVQAFTKQTADVAGMLDNTGWIQSGTNGTASTSPSPDVAGALVIGAITSGAVPTNTNSLAWSFATTIDGAPFALWRSDSQEQQYDDPYGNRWTINGTGWEWRDNDGLKIDGFNVVEPLVGTGFPEGVLNAPVGTPYTDLSATNGAIEWVKASGVGNTGWRVTYGDTGWRNMAPTSTPPTGVTIVTALMRRTNNTVAWRFYWTTTASPGGAISTFNIPPGFRFHDGVSDNTWPCVNSSGTFTGAMYTIAGGVSLVLRPVPSAAVAYGFNYATADTVWPATLP